MYGFVRKEDTHTRRYYVKEQSGGRHIVALIRKKKTGTYSFSVFVREGNQFKKRLALEKYDTEDSAVQALEEWMRQSSLRLELTDY